MITIALMLSWHMLSFMRLEYRRNTNKSFRIGDKCYSCDLHWNQFNTSTFHKLTFWRLYINWQKNRDVYINTFRLTVGCKWLLWQMTFMTRELSKEIMTKSKVKNSYVEWPSRESVVAYKKAKNKCNSLSKKTKRKFFKKATKSGMRLIKSFGKQ